MKITSRNILLSFICILISSCDALLLMPYEVQNKTNKEIKLSIENYPLEIASIGPIGKTTDTIISLKPGKTIDVGYGQAIGFPWETKKIFIKNPGIQNFKLMINDSIVPFNNGDEFWKYANGKSKLKIKEKSSN
jgi:hypothetical protein